MPFPLTRPFFCSKRLNFMLVSHFLGHFILKLILLFQIYLSSQITSAYRSFYFQLFYPVSSHHFIDISFLINFSFLFHSILQHHLGSQYFVCFVSNFSNLSLTFRFLILQKSNSILDKLRLKFILFMDCCQHAQRGSLCRNRIMEQFSI